MRELAFLIALTGAVIAVPTAANDSVSVTVTGTVAPRCVASGFVRQTAGVNSTAIGIGYDANSDTVGQTFASSTVSLQSASPQLLADITARCNTPSATFAMTTDNGFRLRNPVGGAGSEVPFALNLLGQGGASGIISNFTTVISNTGPTFAQRQVRPLQFVLPTLPNQAVLVPGTFSDTIRVTITPNP